MRTSLVALGKQFGNLYKISGTTKYTISPFEQRAFAGYVTKGLPNLLWRFRCNVFYWAPRKSKIQFFNSLDDFLFWAIFDRNLTFMKQMISKDRQRVLNHANGLTIDFLF